MSQSLLSNATADTTGTAVSVSGPATIWVRGDFDGAKVEIQSSVDNVSANFRTVGLLAQITAEGEYNSVRYGAHYLRAKLLSAGTSTDLDVSVSQ